MVYCLLCDWPAADKQFDRVEVWKDDLWRVTTSLAAPIAGFSYLEPRRHIPHITDLGGPEADSLGAVLAKVTTALKRITGAELVYVNVFGERVAHLHFNLAPHLPGDALRGGSALLDEGAQPLPRTELQLLSERFRGELG